MNILKIEDLRKDYDELQVKYGAKELDSIYNGGCEKNQPRVDPVFDLSKQGAFQKGAGSEDRADAGGDYADYRRYAPGGLAGGNPYGSQWEQPGTEGSYFRH